MAILPMRSTAGLDSAGQRAINFGYPDKTKLGDGVNVDFFIQENTVQKHDATRKYPKDFAVTYNDRIYISQVEITVPEAFNTNKWKATRVDPQWRIVTSTSNLQGNVRQGEYILSQVVGANSVYTMPYDVANGIPSAGDTIVIKENGFATHDYEIVVNGNGKNIKGKPTHRITLAGSTTIFIYNGNEWVPQLWAQGDTNRKFVSSSDYIVGEDYFRAKVGDEIMRETQYGGGIRIRLPRYANHGDVVNVYDLDGLNPVTKTEVFVYPNSGHKIITKPGSIPVDTVKGDGSGWGYFVFDTRIDQWRVFDADIKTRWNMIQSNYSAVLGEKLTVYTTAANQTVTIIFPQDAADGDSFFVDTSYMFTGSTVVLSVSTQQANDYIVPDNASLGTPRISNYRTVVADIVNQKSKTETFVVDNRAWQWEFAYIKNALDTGFDVWTLITSTPMPFRVDRNDINFVGMAAIASQAEVNKNREQIATGQNRDSEAFVTPETLSNKVSTVTMRGITRLATDAESKAVSGTSEGYTGVVMTPQRVNDRLATNDMRGVLTTATQAQANAMSGTGEMWSQTAITPSVLDGRKSTETQTGITYQVIKAGIKQTSRTSAGTGVHDFNEHYRYVTPKVLFEKVATDVSQGMVFTATQPEVDAGSVNHVNGPIVVTATTLNGRQATQALTGLSRAATAAETMSNNPTTGNNVHITPVEFVKRTANEVTWGLTETATQAEVDAGLLHDRWFLSPKTFANWISRTRLTVNGVDGLTTAGNFWDGQALGIYGSTESQRGTLRVSTQAEANSMVNPVDDSIVTPKKLNARIASETLTGIIEIATQSESDVGTDAVRAVTPKDVLNSLRGSTNHRMTESRYGVGMMSTLGNDSGANSVWQGNDVSGSTRAITGYATTDIVVSPRGLNTALSHYLPILGVAASSRGMDTSGGTRVAADDWVRRTVDQTITGQVTLTEDLIVNRSSSNLVLLDSAATQSTFVKFLSANSTNGWYAGVGTINGSFQITSSVGGAVTPRMILDRVGNLTVTNTVSNGGQDPTSNNHLTRWGYTEERYVRKTGAITETITGLKTFTSSVNVSAGANNSIFVNLGSTSNKSGISVDVNGQMSVGSNGQLNLRPRGYSDSAGQLTIDTNGVVISTSQVKTKATAPIAADDLTRKDYVDNLIDDVTLSADTRVNKKGDAMTGELIITSNKALTANGDVNITETLTAKVIRISVGNGEFLEIRPNATTRSVDFVWIS